MRFCCVGRFLQIKPGTKGLACTAQNEHAFVWLIGCNFDGSDQLTEQRNGKRIAAFGAIQCYNRDVWALFFDKNDGHENKSGNVIAGVELNLNDASVKTSGRK